MHRQNINNGQLNELKVASAVLDFQFCDEISYFIYFEKKTGLQDLRFNIARTCVFTCNNVPDFAYIYFEISIVNCFRFKEEMQITVLVS